MIHSMTCIKQWIHLQAQLNLELTYTQELLSSSTAWVIEMYKLKFHMKMKTHKTFLRLRWTHNWHKLFLCSNSLTNHIVVGLAYYRI